MAMFSKKYLIVISLLILFSAFFNFSEASKTVTIIPSDQIKIVDQTINVKIADTEIERERGLSGSQKLGGKEGMVFIFNKPDYHYFWMKDMNYPLDIVWIDASGQIIDITPNLDPKSYPNVFTSKKPAQFVLELNAGFVALNKLKIGEKASLTRAKN